MTIQEYLAAQGLTAEEIAAIVGNEKTAKAMTAAIALADEGKAAKSAAEALKAEADAEKAETATYWEEQTKKVEGSVTRLTAAEKRAATAEAKAAQTAAYLKSLADQGYDVPKEMYEGAPPPKQDDKPQYISRADLEKELSGTAPTLIALQTLSNEYFDLFGKPYLTGEADFAEARKAGKGMRDYVRGKYGFDAKIAERSEAALKTKWEAEKAEDFKKKEAELAAKYGSNPQTRVPMPSKFDRLEKSDGFKNDSWKSEEGRKANQSARLKKFENTTLQ